MHSKYTKRSQYVRLYSTYCTANITFLQEVERPEIRYTARLKLSVRMVHRYRRPMYIQAAMEGKANRYGTDSTTTTSTNTEGRQNL